MKRILTIGVIFVLFTVCISGCFDIPDEMLQFSISKFDVEPSIINKGESANLSWIIISAQSASIDHGIGNVSLIGTRIIMPNETTIYTLTARNATKTLTVTTKIIVLENKSEDDDNLIAVIDTTLGIIKVELFEDKAPETCENFIKLVNDGFYENLVFHRVIDDFMIQGGGFYSDGTRKDSPYGSIDLEINEELRHIDGAIAMARTTDPNSATSQFYICDGKQSFLDDNYAVFGVVVDGIDVVRDIASVSTTTKYQMNDWPEYDIIINSITIINNL